MKQEKLLKALAKSAKECRDPARSQKDKDFESITTLMNDMVSTWCIVHGVEPRVFTMNFVRVGTEIMVVNSHMEEVE